MSLQSELRVDELLIGPSCSCSFSSLAFSARCSCMRESGRAFFAFARACARICSFREGPRRCVECTGWDGDDGGGGRISDVKDERSASEADCAEDRPMESTEEVGCCTKPSASPNGSREESAGTSTSGIALLAMALPDDGIMGLVDLRATFHDSIALSIRPIVDMYTGECCAGGLAGS